MLQIRAKLIKNIEVAQKYYTILLSCPTIAKTAQPGQFIEIKVSDTKGPFLRRPFSIHRARVPHIEVLYEVLGQGTEILSRRKPGEDLDIVGPLGNGFDYQTPEPRYSAGFPRQQTPILVAGGLGVAPLFFLAEKIVTKSQSHKVTRNLLVLIGAKTKRQILCADEFRKLGCTVRVATDDGSEGFRGKVTDLLKQLLRTESAEPRAKIYSCGPRPMLKEIAMISKRNNIPAQISLEEHMACGIGACLGCVANTIAGYKRVCKDGPVFDSREVIW